MTLGGVRGQFRGVMDGLGFREWSDGFNFENIPSSILDKAYHIEVGTITSGPSDHQAHRFLMPMTLRVFFKGYRDPSFAIDDALTNANTILGGLLAPGFRLQVNDLKDIRPTSINALPLQLTNDNAVILEMGFVAYLIYLF